MTSVPYDENDNTNSCPGFYKAASQNLYRLLIPVSMLIISVSPVVFLYILQYQNPELLGLIMYAVLFLISVCLYCVL